ncbi:hypothetical protein O181_023205 [Austropuccinia psidii MF-1]|uniref:Uncharacterized protein n=1 Tax=Austropuccinia psidii MF-1 TaxID=1389203 RepID=A0A9Q3GYV3_9BASI|nr:hypothetical protein [Austropuccinia psidii MF-1]
MPVPNSYPEIKTRSQARPQAVLTPTPREPLDGTPAVPQLNANLDRGKMIEGEESSVWEEKGPTRSRYFSAVVGSFPGMSKTTFKGLGEDSEKEEERLLWKRHSLKTLRLSLLLWRLLKLL